MNELQDIWYILRTMIRNAEVKWKRKDFIVILDYFKLMPINLVTIIYTGTFMNRITEISEQKTELNWRNNILDHLGAVRNEKYIGFPDPLTITRMLLLYYSLWIVQVFLYRFLYVLGLSKMIMKKRKFGMGGREIVVLKCYKMLANPPNSVRRIKDWMNKVAKFFLNIDKMKAVKCKNKLSFQFKVEFN